jgi:hypothetical protein
MAHPFTGRETAHEPSVEAAGMTIVDVFDDGIGFELRIFQTAAERLVLAPIPLLVDDQSQALFKAEPRGFGIFHLAMDGFGHTGEFHRIEFFDRGLH